MERQLYLHIGTHKTGTTSLQRYVLDHRDELRDRGLGVVTETGPRGRTSANCDGVADVVLRSGLVTGARARDRFPPGRHRGYLTRLRSLRAEVGALDAPRVLVSAEGLCFARTRAERVRIRTLVRACGASPVVIVCLRDVEHWRASWLDQVAKIGYPGVRTLRRSADDIRGDWYFDGAAIVAFWSRVGEVRTIEYESAMALHGSVIPDVIAATDTEMVPPSRTYQLNRRPETG